MPDDFGGAYHLHVDDDGRVTADFDGRVHAQGIDLDAGDDDQPAEDRTVRWARADGAAIAQLLGYEDAVEDVLSAFAVAPDIPTPKTAVVRLGAAGSTGGAAMLDVRNEGDFDAAKAIVARTQREFFDPIQDTLIVDDTGASGFLQLRVPSELKLAIGSTVIASAGGGTNVHTLALGFAWPTNHLFFGAWIATSSVNDDVHVRRSTVLSTSEGRVAAWSGTAQNLTFKWISLGN